MLCSNLHHHNNHKHHLHQNYSSAARPLKQVISVGRTYDWRSQFFESQCKSIFASATANVSSLLYCKCIAGLLQYSYFMLAWHFSAFMIEVTGPQSSHGYNHESRKRMMFKILVIEGSFSVFFINANHIGSFERLVPFHLTSSRSNYFLSFFYSNNDLLRHIFGVLLSSAFHSACSDFLHVMIHYRTLGRYKDRCF